MENQKQSDYYLNKLTSHTTFLILFAVLTVIMYFIFMRNEKISFDFFSTLLAFSTLALIFVYISKFCIKTAGLLVGFIISVVLFIVIICKFDDLLVKCGLPTDDSVYNPFFDIIGLAILGYHIYGIISNFKKFNSLSKLENEQYILDQTQSDKQES